MLGWEIGIINLFEFHTYIIATCKHKPKKYIIQAYSIRYNVARLFPDEIFLPLVSNLFLIVLILKFKTILMKSMTPIINI